MDNIKLFLLKIILASIILNMAESKDHIDKGIRHHTKQSSIENNQNEHKIFKADSTPLNNNPKTIANAKKHRKHMKKSKRETYGNYGKYWARKSSNFGYGGSPSNSMPLYLVYNRKVGAYYPYYKFPKENSVRRSSNVRKGSRNYNYDGITTNK